MSVLLTRLRAATTAAHEQLHVHPVLRPLNEADVTEDVYRNALIKFYGFYKPLEDLFATSDLKLLQEFQNEALLSNLVSDLEGLGVTVSQLPLRAINLERLTLEQGIGYLYLREGSTLGGQVISKNLARSLGKSPGTDNKYFYGRGEETGPAWKRFTALLQNIEDKIKVEDTALFAASLFSHLDEWLSLEQKNAEI